MKVYFIAKYKGAIGIFQEFIHEMEESNIEQIREKLYETYDHIQFLEEEEENGHLQFSKYRQKILNRQCFYIR